MFFFNFLKGAQKKIFHLIWIISILILFFWVFLFNSDSFEYYVFYDTMSSSSRRFQVFICGGLIVPMTISFLLFLIKDLQTKYKRNNTAIAKLTTIIILAVMIFGIEYYVYDVLRLICCGFLGFICFYERNKIEWLITWIISILIFQPFIKVNFERELWIAIDITLVALLLISLITNSKKVLKEN